MGKKKPIFTLKQIKNALNRGGREFGDPEDLESEAQELMEFFNLFVSDSNIEIFRVVHAKSEEEINLEALGKHWTHSEHKALEFAQDNLSRPWFLISAKVDYSKVDWAQTLFQNIHHPHEEEIHIFKQRSFKVVKVKKV